MNIEDGKISLAWSGIKPLEDEFPAAGNVGQSEILRRRAYKNQVIILSVVQREKRATLNPKLAIEEIENVIELVDRQHFSNASVVIENECARVRRRIEVAHASLGATDEAAVAEDHPRLLRAGDETIPKNLVGGRHWLDGDRLRAGAGQEDRACNERSRQHDRKNNDESGPALIRRRSLHLLFGRFDGQRSRDWGPRPGRAQVER